MPSKIEGRDPRPRANTTGRLWHAFYRKIPITFWMVQNSYWNCFLLRNEGGNFYILSECPLIVLYFVPFIIPYMYALQYEYFKYFLTLVGKQIIN